MTPPVVLAVAGTDSGGGAGLAADLATFAAFGVHGTCVVTAVTAQDTTGVHAVHPVPIDIVTAQLDAVLADLRPTVIKTGMLASPEAVVCLSQRITDVSGTRPLQVVVDPVLRSSTGATLADERVIAAYREHLLPLATVITPNADEDAVLGHPRHTAVVVTGSGEGPDRLIRPGLPAPRIDHDHIRTRNDHGTGCTYASALAARLAHGADLATAATDAAAYVGQQLRTSSTWVLGRDRGPVAHVHNPATGGESA